MFASIQEASMIDKKLGEKPLFFELSIGNAGNILDGHNESAQEPYDSDSDDNLGKYCMYHYITILHISWLIII